MSPSQDPLDPLVQLCSGKVDQNHSENDSPLPSQRTNLEYLVVDDWNVDDGESTQHEDNGAPK